MAKGKIQQSLRFFLENPPSFIDSVSLNLKGFEFNILRDDRSFRKVILISSFIVLGVWMVAGFDSTASQIAYFFKNMPDYLTGRITLDEWIDWYHFDYGRGMHWSAFTIYGLAFWYISRHLAKIGVVNSRNLTISFAITLMSIAVFETFWHHSFSFFQNQPWVITWKWPQFKVLLQNFGFGFLGVFTIFVVYLEHGKDYFLSRWRHKEYRALMETHFPTLRLNFDRWTLFFIVLTLMSIQVWWFYGNYFEVQSLEVEVTTPRGVETWTNTPYFPQTVYTIDTDTTDSVNAGVQFWKSDDLLHGVNTVCKILMTMAFVSAGRMTMVKQYERVKETHDL